MATMQAREMAAKETAGNQRRINVSASVGCTCLVSIRRGSIMSVCSRSSNPAGAGARDALRNTCSIRSSFIVILRSSRPEIRFVGVGAQEVERLTQAVFHRAGGDAQRLGGLVQRQTLIIVQMDGL